MSQNIEKALNGEIKELFGKFAIPGMIGMLIVSLYNFVDGIFVGQFVGPDAVGAISITIPVVIVNQAITILFGSGAMALLARSIGAKDQVTRDKIFGTLTLSVTLLSFLFSLIIFFFSKEIMVMLGAKDNLIISGDTYLKILAIGFVFSAIGPAVNMLLRGEGKMKESMLIMTVGTVLNIILDPILIYSFKMGVAGAAVATVISQGVIFIISILYIRTKKSVVPVSLKHFRIYPEILPQILPVGMGPMIMLLMVVIQQTFLFKFLSNMGGRDQLALMGASYRVYYFAFVPMWGLGQGLLPLIGMNYGAQNFKRVMAIFTSFTLKATVIALVMWGVLMIFGRSVLSWFITDTHLVSYGTGLFKILNGAVFIAGLLNTPIVLFQAIGKAKQPMIICIGRQVFFFIPLLLVLPRFLGVLGIWLAIPISDFIIALIAFGLVIREKKYMHMGIRSEPLVANQNQAKVSVKNSDWPEGEILSDMITNEKRKVHISPDLLGLQKNSKHQQIKARLTQIVQQLLKDLGINRTEAVKLLGVTQEQASALIHCFPGPVSIGCLLECLTTLGQNVEVTIKPASCVKVMVTTSSPQRCSPQEAGSTLEGEDGPLGATVLEFAANIVSIKYPGRKKQPFQGSTSDLSLD